MSCIIIHIKIYDKLYSYTIIVMQYKVSNE